MGKVDLGPQGVVENLDPGNPLWHLDIEGSLPRPASLDKAERVTHQALPASLLPWTRANPPCLSVCLTLSSSFPDLLQAWPLTVAWLSA